MQLQPMIQASHKPAGVQELISATQFHRLRSEWNALVERNDDQIYFRHEFFAAWLAAFHTGAWRLLTLRDRDGELAAVLPLLLRQTRLHGLPIRQLESAANLHSGRFDLIADDPEAAAAAFIEHLAGQDDWDTLRLTDVPVDGRAGAMLTAAQARGWPVGRWPAMNSPRLMLPADQASFEARLGSHFRANVRRRRRALERLGELRFERHVANQDLLESGMALEARGWKGRAGTAMNQDPATSAFYRGLCRALGETGSLALWGLTLDKTLVAFHLGLEHRGVYALLKPAYDEGFARYSPGQVLMAEVIADGIGRGLDCIDFLGEDMPWKRDWCPEYQTHEWLYVFSPRPWSRLLRALKFGLGRQARRWTGRVVP